MDNTTGVSQVISIAATDTEPVLAIPLTTSEASFLQKIKHLAYTLLQTTGSRLSHIGSDLGTTRRNAREFKNPFFFVPIIVIILLLGVIVFLLMTSGSRSTVLGDSRAAIEQPKATEQINKDFNFPLRDSAGKQVSSLKVTFQNAELRDQILIKGAKATAVQGRTFLVLNVKISNSYDKAVQINARDFVRLSVNGSSEKLAPDIHNDPVEVQAISTKVTRLGFPINDTDKKPTLYIGEIAGAKATVTLHFHE